MSTNIDYRVRELEQSSVKHTLLIDQLINRLDQDEEKNKWATRLIISTLVGALILPALILMLTLYFNSI